MAFSNYHEKFRQIGTNQDSYESWVDSNSLLSLFKRLKVQMQHISSTDKDTDTSDAFNINSFERKLSSDFSEEDFITEKNNGTIVCGVYGVCDWVNEGLEKTNSSKQGHHQKYNINLLEIKSVHQVSNVNRLQLLVYCALYSLESNNACKGMLYNVRTGEIEICSIQACDAMPFLLDISQFKYNGKHRKRTLTC